MTLRVLIGAAYDIDESFHCRAVFRERRLLAPATACAIHEADRSRRRRYEWLANTLAAVRHPTVVNKTGFTGKFDLDLECAPVEDTADTSRPWIFTALQDRPGLRLEAAKGTVKVLVVDHVERPSDN